MQRDLIVKGRSLGGTSDLTLLATIKPGFAESLESVTYKTRIKRVLETLHGARMAAHEHAHARLLSDAVERVGVIHSVRVAVLEPEEKVLLAVTFDGSWESYIRVLWDKVGTLLDLIFCGTVDYVTAHDHTFEEWLAWARRVQVETGFFYGPADGTAQDLRYHRRIERTRQRGAGTELNEIRAVAPSAEEAVDRLTRGNPSTDPDEPPATVTRERMGYERFRNGFLALAGLYRLTDMYRPGTPDGDVLRLASISLLREFIAMWNAGYGDEEFEEARGEDGAEGRFKRQLDWLIPDSARPVGVARARPDFQPLPAEVDDDVQGGILCPYEANTHGVALLLAFDHPAAAAAFLEEAEITTHRQGSSATVHRNLAFTPAGLRACGLAEDDLELFPEEFRQGMAERAGLLGDVRSNHPRRWNLPRRLVALGQEADVTVDMASVHAVLQLRCVAVAHQMDAVDVSESGHPLHDEVQAWLRRKDLGIHVLAAQSLKRQFRQLPDGKQVVTEHFGYADGGSEPSFAQDAPASQRIHLGEILLGHDNSADEAAAGGVCPVGAPGRRLHWLRNGSFLVMRKYRQYPNRLRERVEQAARDMAATLAGATPGAAPLGLLLPQPGAAEGPTVSSLQLGGAAPGAQTAIVEACEEVVYAKLMGRRRDGESLIASDTPGWPNAFDYKRDQQGKACPLHAHIRRANPRAEEGAMARPPRVVRRSMSYGPYADQDGPEDDCGLLFMAYNANLGEQFEVIQRWLAGGNSTGSSSGQSCPIVGVPEAGWVRRFRFEYDGAQLMNMALETQTPTFDEPEAVTRLQWGLYLFAPSISVLGRLHRAALAAATREAAANPVPWRVARGRAFLAELRALEASMGKEAAIEAWKAAIEDPEAIDRLDSAALWAAIREDHAGVLRTPYGVIVASREALGQVYMDPEERYSVSGQMDRMRRSIGEIALGEDAGPKYDEAAGPMNDVIMDLDPDEVFTLAAAAANGRMAAIRSEAEKNATKGDETVFDVSFDAREVVDEVLAVLSEAWFGLKGSPYFRRGSADWGWTEGDPPVYPGHFTALSRYMFQPHPGPVPVELGQRYGNALREAMLKFVRDHRAAGTIPQDPHGPQGRPARIARAIFTHPTLGHDDAFVAKTLVGVLMGFTPTIIGAVLNVLREWHRDGRFWSLRAQCAGRPLDTLAAARSLLMPAMQAASRMRPMPQIAWRTVRKAHRLGPSGPHAVDVAVGDTIVLGMVSGTQQSLADGQEDGRLMFGGVRSKTAPHPTHACPGYEAGIAAMLGTLSALLMRGEQMRQGPGPLDFELRGSLELEGEVPGAEVQARRLKHGSKGLPQPEAARQRLLRINELGAADTFGLTARKLLAPAVARARNGLVLAWGDSWLDFSAPWPYEQDSDLMNCLQDLEYVVNDGDSSNDRFCNYRDWLHLKVMRENTWLPNENHPQRKEGPFLAYVRSMVGRRPRAILLSGGGNDSVRSTLATLLKQANDADPVDHLALAAHVETLCSHYEVVVKGIKEVLESCGVDIPIIVHGYDYPVPFHKFGRLNRLQYPWLQEPFLQRGYGDPQDPKKVNLQVAQPAMVTIIDALNRMLAQDLPQRVPFVRYLKLTGTLEPYWDGNEKPGWHNNMHPNAKGFEALAKKLADFIEQHAPAAV